MLNNCAYVLTQNVQSTMMCVRRCAQHWRKWAHNKSLQRPKQLDQQQQQWNIHSSQTAINGVNTEWINLVKYVKIVIVHLYVYVCAVFIV